MSGRVIALLMLLSSSVVSAAGGGAGKIVKVQGQVFIRAPGGSEGAAQVGTTLVAGTQVRTGADGSAEISFEDGSLLRMQRRSSILLSANKRQKQKNAVLLFFGRIWSKVSPSRTGDTSYEVATANAVCGVRGTEFETQVGDDGSLRMQVIEGKVAVESDAGEELAEAGQQIEADEGGVEDPEATNGQTFDKWQAEKRERFRTSGEGIVKSIKGKILTRQQRLEALRARQLDIEEQRKGAEARAREGDESALDEIRKYNQQLAEIADQIADIGDEAAAQFGIVDHFADLAADPRFALVSRKYIEMEAASLRRVKADLDELVAQGTDISIEGMEKLLDDMSRGKGSLREKKGSSTQDLFEGDELEMQ